jgi:DNA-binding beta-propeller fold protein YncE
MSIIVQCSGCHRELRAPDTALGKSIRCSQCGAKTPVTGPQAAPKKPRPAAETKTTAARPPARPRPAPAREETPEKPRPATAPREAPPPKAEDAAVSVPGFLHVLCILPTGIVALAGIMMLLDAGPMWEGRLGQFWMTLGALLTAGAFGVARMPKVPLAGRCLMVLLLAAAGYGAVGGFFVATGGLQSEEPPAWREFSLPSAGFRVLMPGPPERKTQMVDTPEGPRPQAHVSVERLRGKVVFAVVYNDLTAQERARPAEGFLDEMQAAILAEVKNQQNLSQTALRLDGFPGRELLAEGTPKGTLHWRLYVARGRLYQTLASHPNGAAYAADAAKFLDSFKLIEPPPPEPDEKKPAGPDDKPPPPASTAGRQAGPAGPFEGHKAGITWVDVSPKGDLVVTSSDDGAVKLWDLLTGKETASLPADTTVGVGRLAFGPDGATLAVAGRNDSRVTVWDLGTHQPKLTVPAGPKGVTALAFSPDGKLLAIAHYEQVKLWDLARGKESSKFDHRDGMVGLAFSPDGKTLYQLGSNAKVYPLDVPTSTKDRQAGRQPGKVWDPGHTPFNTTSLALSKDGKLLAAGVYDYVRLWDTGTASLRTDVKFGAKQVGGVALSPDGKLLATVSRSVTLWDLETGKELAVIEAGQQADQALFSPDGARLVLRVYGKIKVYEVVKVLDQKRVP